MYRVNFSEYAAENGFRHALIPFCHNGRLLEDGAPLWGMTLLASGSMRFRWNETNSNRDAVLKLIFGTRQPVPVELIHSKTVYDVVSASDTELKTGDGILTADRNLVPVITVADCMPLFIYDVKKGITGAFHSGWRGTGIVGEGIRMAVERYGSDSADICAAIGPHIRDCCYIIEESRAAWFSENFTPECVVPLEDGILENGNALDVLTVKNFFSQGKEKLFRLSLEKANLSVLSKCGIKDENIIIAGDCTCSSSVFGSFRRQAAFNENLPTTEEKSRGFTVQAAFVMWK